MTDRTLHQGIAMPDFTSETASKTPAEPAGVGVIGYAPVEAVDHPLYAWKAIWLRPRQVVRRVIDTDPTRRVFVLIAVAAFSQALGDSGTWAASIAQFLTSVGVNLLILTPIYFAFLYFVAPWVLTFDGRLIGGQGDRVALRAAVAYGSIPMICAIPFFLGLLAVNAAIVWYWQSGSPALPFLGYAYAAAYYASVGLALWWIVLLIGAVSAAHRFSIWRAIVTVVIVGLPIYLLSIAPPLIQL